MRIVTHGLAGIPADIELAVINILMAVGVNLPAKSAMFMYVQEHFGIPSPIFAMLLGLVFSISAFIIFYFRPRGQYYSLATIPLIAYIAFGTFVILQTGVANMATVVLQGVLLYVLYKNFSLQSLLFDTETALLAVVPESENEVD